MSENKLQFETDNVINEKLQGTIARHLRLLWHFQWQFTANSPLIVLVKEF